MAKGIGHHVPWKIDKVCIFMCESHTITSEIDIIGLLSYYLVKCNVNEDREKAMMRGTCRDEKKAEKLKN
jgi:hypothetical protein